MIDTNSGRTWDNAPRGVRDARTLAYLGLLGSGLLVIVLVWLLMSGGFHEGFTGSLILFVYALFFPLYIWLLIGLKRGTKAAYYVQLLVAILGLTAFPVGTLINGYILFKWFRPETRAWFGV
jgi:hypothetical protein